MNDIEEEIVSPLHKWLINVGIGENTAIYLKMLILFFIVCISAFIIDITLRKIFLTVVHRFAAKTKSKFDDVLIEKGTFKYLGHVFPAILVRLIIPIVFHDFNFLITPLQELIDVYVVIMIVLFVQAIIRSSKIILREKPSLKDKPIDSIAQLINIINYIIGFIFLFSEITGKSVGSFFAAAGAASAILLLIFKDTILGFVSSLQLATNDMVRIGDWISMEKYGADGNVIEISLNTVKVQNFDKTITTIPTYKLMSDSFKNWRGMENSQGRRIKRALNISISSVKFLSEDEVEELQNVELISTYLKSKYNEIKEYNKSHTINKSIPINGRHLTNIGVFRKYMEEYIKLHPLINENLTLMVRQLAPTEKGIPLEVYSFSSDKAWVNYENIISDIFDHMLASAPHFKLDIFESPAGKDFERLLRKKDRV